MTAKRGAQARPTKAEIRDLWRFLKRRVQQGDVQAAAELIRLSERENLNELK